MNYTKAQLQEALQDFKEFIRMTESSPKGIPIRLEIARDLIEKELNCD